MFTSRAEHRLLLRQDNADRRLTPIGFELGLVDASRMQRLREKELDITRMRQVLADTRFEQQALEKWLRRPDVGWERMCAMHAELAGVETEVARQIEFDVKYAGYITRQNVTIERQRRFRQVDSRMVDYGASFICGAKPKQTESDPSGSLDQPVAKRNPPADLTLVDAPRTR
jgi:tRNA uridine 5-carboxymethylaminomethyl modification enzyme